MTYEEYREFWKKIHTNPKDLDEILIKNWYNNSEAGRYVSNIETRIMHCINTHIPVRTIDMKIYKEQAQINRYLKKYKEMIKRKNDMEQDFDVSSFQI